MPVETFKRLADYAHLVRDAYKLKKSDDEHVRRQVRRHLIRRMGKLRGLPQKLGQLLSVSHDDQDAAADYALLQERAEPLPLDVLLPVVRRAWGKPVDDVLADIDPHGYAASLGQVHRATTHDGLDVAIKVQYPEIREKIVADLKLLGWLSAGVGGLGRGFDVSQYRRVILDDLDRELDYRQEAESQKQFCEWADTCPFLAVPGVVDSLSSESVLVTHWEEGDSMSTVEASWNDDEKRQLAQQLLPWFLESLFSRRMIHADLHPGNVRFRRTSDGPQLLLYDFGCVYRADENDALALLRLIRATIRRDESPWPLFLKLGFQRQYLKPLAQKLPPLCQLLFEPFCVEYPYNVADWRLGQRVADVLGEDRWNFRIAGPAALVFLLRAFHYLMYYLQGCSCGVSWCRAIQPHLDQHSEAMDRLDLPTAAEGDEGFATLARYLKIRVREANCTKVELTSYARGIDDLSSLIDDDLLKKIASQGIDIDSIVADVRRRGYAPGGVFELEDADKHVAIWLE